MRAGQRIGKYVLGEQIARGGMAEVWAARVEGPEGFVKSLALKFILETFKGDADLERLFVNEARVAAQLQHANLVSVFDFDKVHDGGPDDPGRYYIAMERVDGHDLRRILQVARHKGARMPPAIALHVIGEVLKALRYVHDRRDASGQKPLGLVHRDVSPHNVLVGMGGEVKLSDFGIAKAMTQSLGTGAGTGTIRGKLAYASPEQLRGEPVDHRTDQFGAGVTLWEMLSGARLFDGPDEAGIIGKVMRCEIAPLAAELRVDPAVEGIARRMLSSQVAGRFPSTGDALAAVLAAPGYTSDASSLAELMRELFVPRPIALPRTLPMKLADPSPVPVGGLAETSPLDRRSSESPVRPGGGIVASSTGPRGGSAASTAPDRPRHGSGPPPDGAREAGSSGSSGAAVARTKAAKASPGTASRTRRGRAADPKTAAAAASDSGYVSSASLEVPTAPPRASLVARPVQIAVVATAALSAAVGAFTLVSGSRRHARPPAGAEAPVAPPPLPPAPVPVPTVPKALNVPMAPSEIAPASEPEPRPKPQSPAPPPSTIVESPLDSADDREPSRSSAKPAPHSTHHARVAPRDATTDPHPDRHGLAKPSSAVTRSSRAADAPNGSPILE